MIDIYAIAEELREQDIQPDDIDAIMAAAQLDYRQAEYVSDQLQFLQAHDDIDEDEDREEDDEDT